MTTQDPTTENEKVKVVFQPAGRQGEIPAGTTLLEAARRLGVEIESICGGHQTCGKCKIVVEEGDFAKFAVRSAADHLTAPEEREVAYAERRKFGHNERLSCACQVLGDLIIRVPEESQTRKQVVRKAVGVERQITVDAPMRLYYVELPIPEMKDHRGDWERLRDELRAVHGLGPLHIDPAILPTVQPALAKEGRAVTVTLFNGAEVVRVQPGFHDTIYGVAVDVGTTTVALHLCHLRTGEVLATVSRMNPQVPYGEDLMSRVSYAMLHPGGAAEMTRAVREALNRLVGEVAAAAGVERAALVEVTLVGNPVMHHLLLGIDPVELGHAPFALAVGGALHLAAAGLGLDALAPAARAYVLPCIAGHVGADAAAVALATAPDQSGELMLVVDVGTNAEILLGSRDRLLACSSPTGPAFEGAQISAGQRAAPGAIERVRIDPVTKEPRIRVIGCELWSDEPGFAEATAATGVTGICGSGIIEAVAEMRMAGILDASGLVGPAVATGTARCRPEGRTHAYLLHDGTPPILVTQGDVRAIQLAKSALYAGARLLMDALGVERVDRIVLAGAFGAHISPLHAMVLGMIPDAALDAVTSAGNAAGTGARMALVSRAARRQVEALVGRIEKVETAIAPRFQEHFVAANAIPHAADPFPHLAAEVSLPAPAFNAGEAGGRRRRRG